MFPRPVLLAALLGLVVAPGCAAPAPHPPKPHIIVAPPAGEPRPTIVAKPTEFAARPSELESVTEDKPDPEAQRAFQARIAQPAIRLTAAPPPPVTKIALDDTRRGEAPGMKEAGPIYLATLAEGQRATLPVKLAPGECVTYIAQGGLGVIEVDLFLTTGEGSAGRILAEDPGAGPIAVIGGHGRCFEGARETGTAALLHAMVRRGAGVVLVGSYKK
jgi:hypothetical protein